MAKVNNLQKQLQDTELLAQPGNQKQLQRLNNLDAQAWLYLGIIDQLGKPKVESHERIAKTIQALRRKRCAIRDYLDPCKPPKYLTLERFKAKIRTFFAFLPSLKAQTDFSEIESIINELTRLAKDEPASETFIQDLVKALSLQVSHKASKISPSRLSLIYQLEELLNSISQKDISNLSKSELDKLNEDIVNELKAQRNNFAKAFKNLLHEKFDNQAEINRYSKIIISINKSINDQQLTIAKLNEKLDKFTHSDAIKQNKINALNSKLNELERQNLDLKSQLEILKKKKRSLINKIEQQETEIDNLNIQLNKYSKIRVLEGKYIGNLSNKSSKYHFNQKCRDWKMLVGEYVLHLNADRDILSSKNPNVFKREGLEECEFCSKQK